MSTNLLERADALPRRPPARRRRRRRRATALLAVVVVVAGGTAGVGQAVHLHRQVTHGRRALEVVRRLEAAARTVVLEARATAASARAARQVPLASDAQRRRERAQAQALLTQIEARLAATHQVLTSTAAAEAQVAQYTAQRDGCIRGVRTATVALQHGDSKAAIAALRAAADACSTALAAATGARFPYDFPDPSMLTVGSRVYAYSTNSGTGNIQVLVSRDLVHWAIVGDGLASLPSWAAPGATWAPAVVARGADFVAYYTAREIATGRQCVSVATATAPAGPFVDASHSPLTCQKAGSIDPSPFVDERGTAWLQWKSEATGTYPATIWSQRLADDGLSLVGHANAILTPGQSWERGVVEAPSMIRVGGRDYLFYSGGFWTTVGYAEGVVACDGPAGPCHHLASAPVLASSGRLGGPGGGGVLSTASGALWLAFHAFTEPAVGYPNSRTLHLASVRIVGGVPSITPE